jgi:hypothetical protein
VIRPDGHRQKEHKIMQTAHLSSRHAHTVGRIYQHPASHNLEWRDVTALIEHLGTVEEKENGHLTFTVNGVSQVFHRSSEKDVSEIQQVLDLRHFLESAGVDKDGRAAMDATIIPLPLNLLVVINQKETLVFRTEEKDSVPERLHPYDPTGALNRLIHTEGVDKASRSPENLAYYEAIAETLAGAKEILLMGNGTGASRAMTHVEDYLTTHHPDLARKVVGTLAVDVEALTEDELLKQARTFFNNLEMTADP